MDNERYVHVPIAEARSQCSHIRDQDGSYQDITHSHALTVNLRVLHRIARNSCIIP